MKTNLLKQFKGFINVAINKTHIQVFVTKTNKFRAIIKEGNDPTYEVTVNGESWKNGKGREYEKEIRKKMKGILGTLALENV